MHMLIKNQSKMQKEQESQVLEWQLDKTKGKLECFACPEEVFWSLSLLAVGRVALKATGSGSNSSRDLFLEDPLGSRFIGFSLSTFEGPRELLTLLSIFSFLISLLSLSLETRLELSFSLPSATTLLLSTTISLVLSSTTISSHY